jgi:hypothetical protein
MTKLRSLVLLDFQGNLAEVAAMVKPHTVRAWKERRENTWEDGAEIVRAE